MHVYHIVRDYYSKKYFCVDLMKVYRLVCAVVHICLLLPSNKIYYRVIAGYGRGVANCEVVQQGNVVAAP